jgi:pyruvate,water dikinase
MYTRGNAAEILADPCSPLGWSMVWDPGVAMGCRDAFIRFGIVNDDELTHGAPEPFGHFGGYMYNPLSMSRLMGVRMPGATPEAIDKAYFGDDPTIPPYVAEDWHENPDNSARLAVKMGAIMTATEYRDAEIDKATADRIRAQRPDYAAMSPRQLVAFCRSLVPQFRRNFDTHADVTLATSLPTGAMQALCDAVGHPEWAMPLISGYGGVDSAAPSFAMWDMSRLAKASAHLTKAFEQGVEGLYGRLAADTSDDAKAFRAALGAFMAEFGSRGPNEWEIIADVWETKPELVLQAIDLMRRTADSESPYRRAERLEAERRRLEPIIAELLAADAEASATLQMAIASTAIHVRARERSKANNIKVIHEARMATRELGRQLFAQGVLDDPMDVYMVLDAELDTYLDDPAAMRSELAVRAVEWRQLFDLEPPFVVDGRQGVPPLDAWPRRTEVAAVALAVGETAPGIAGCAGVVRGRARVILDLDDADRLEPGDILVTVATDPSWTPLFVAAGGVVTNTGAPASHAVIVSRELGIPCVVSIANATRRIPDGALIEVDGDHGTVTLLEQ